MLFTDESRFCLDFTDRRQLVWRIPKERLDEMNVAEHNRYGKGSVMVWAGTSVNGKTDVYVIEQYLHFHCESLNEPLHLRCGSYLHEQSI